MSQGFLSHLRPTANMFRWGINLWPPFWAAGIRVVELADDYSKAVVRLRLGLLNRNYFGTHFGGSLFAMTDPFHALLLLHNLPRGYIVWDKAAVIQFKSPGRGDVFARFQLSQQQIDEVLAATANGEKFEPTWSVDVVDQKGTLIATIDKTLYIRRAQPASTG